MKHTVGRLTIILILLTLATSCTKEIEYNLLKGTLEGKVFSYGLNNDNLFHVSIKGNNQIRTATTDGSGQYLFTGLTTGTYNLEFTKEGFGTCYIYGFPFIGGDSITEFAPTVNLNQLPNASVSNLTIELTDHTFQNQVYKKISLTARFSPDNTMQTQYIAYLSSDPDVSYTNYKKCYPVIDSHILYLNDNNIINDYTILFKKNTTLYMVIYPYNGLGSTYTDMKTGCTVYSGIQASGASNIASVVVK